MVPSRLPFDPHDMDFAVRILGGRAAMVAAIPALSIRMRSRAGGTNLLGMAVVMACHDVRIASASIDRDGEQFFPTGRITGIEASNPRLGSG
jgi:hypothetical protein